MFLQDQKALFCYNVVGNVRFDVDIRYLSNIMLSVRHILTLILNVRRIWTGHCLQQTVAHPAVGGLIVKANVPVITKSGTNGLWIGSAQTQNFFDGWIN